eukprot:5179789-Amphidinium_carterae.1
MTVGAMCFCAQEGELSGSLRDPLWQLAHDVDLQSMQHPVRYGIKHSSVLSILMFVRGTSPNEHLYNIVPRASTQAISSCT